MRYHYLVAVGGTLAGEHSSCVVCPAMTLSEPQGSSEASSASRDEVSSMIKTDPARRSPGGDAGSSVANNNLKVKRILLRAFFQLFGALSRIIIMCRRRAKWRPIKLFHPENLLCADDNAMAPSVGA